MDLVLREIQTTPQDKPEDIRIILKNKITNQKERLDIFNNAIKSAETKMLDNRENYLYYKIKKETLLGERNECKLRIAELEQLYNGLISGKFVL